jgi:hypothetical protein
VYSVKKLVPNWAKLAVHQSISRYQRAKWRIRCLPDFIVIGAQKSGTSSLFYYLSQHPQLIPSAKKEVHFFDGGLDPDVDNFSKGQVWYRSHFPQKWDTKKNRKVFEASPLYIFNPLAPQRISELIPEVKLIAILRNPTERAISHYFHEQQRGYESLPVLEALRAEEERLKPVLDRQDYKNDIFIHHSYKSRGLYYEQIKRYLDYFPTRNILVINSETLFTQPDDTLRRVFKFVGVDTEFTVKDLKARNVGSNKTEIDPGVHEYLEDYFRFHNQELYELIGENYGWR